MLNRSIAKRLTLTGQMFILCPAFCLLSSAFIFFVTCPSLSASDGWAATYGGSGSEQAYSIYETRDGGYIVAGATRSFGAGEPDVWVLKLNPDGTVDWQKAYGGVGVDLAYSIQQTSDGGYITAGWTESFGAGLQDLWVLKLRPDGTVEWQKTYGRGGTDEGYSIQQTRDGGYIVAGCTTSFGVIGISYGGFWVLKLRPDGTVEWQKSYGGKDIAWANSIHETRDRGYIAAGWAASPRSEQCDFLVLKLSSYGTVEWQKTYGGDDYDKANCIQQTSDGGYVVAGETQSFGTGSKEDIWVLKLGPDGTVEWQKTYGGGGSDEANSIQQTSEGGYIVAGETRSFGAGEKDIWVLKLWPDGAVEWQKTYGGVKDDRANSVQQISAGGYIVAGWIGSFGTRGGLWVLKLTPDGSICPSCDFIKDTSISGRDSTATVKTVKGGEDSNVSPRDSSATGLDTNASVYFLCPP